MRGSPVSCSDEAVVLAMTDKPKGVLGRLAGAVSARRPNAPVVTWQPERGRYPRLLSFDPEALAGRAGLYVLWHLGVRPQWVRVGFCVDLGAGTARLAAAPEIAVFSVHDGPFLSWALCPAESAPGFVNFLARRLNPAAQDVVLECDLAADPVAPPVACGLPSGTKDIQGH